jgi:hypothetical protein
MKDITPTVTTVSGTVAVGGAVTTPPSILKLPVTTFFDGQYILYLSDIVTLCGLAVGLIGAFVGVHRYLKEKKRV